MAIVVAFVRNQLERVRAASRETQLFVATFALLLALSGSLAIAYELAPFLDWPEHLAAAATTLHLHDPAYDLDQYYVRPTWFQPYHVFRWAQMLLGFVGGRVGLRAALLIPIWGMPLLAYVLARQTGRDRWVALAAYCITIEANLQWGFLPYATGIVVLLGCVAIFNSWVNTRRDEKLLVLAALAVVAFFTHPVPTLLVCITLGVLATVELARRRLRLVETFAVAGALLPASSLLLIFVFGSGWVSGHGTADGSASAIPLPTWESLKGNIILAGQNSGLTLVGNTPAWCYGASVVALGVGASLDRLRRSSSNPAPAQWTAGTLALLFVVLSLTLPGWWKGESLGVRVVSTAALFVLIAIPFRATHPTGRWLVRGAIVGAAVASLVFWQVRFARFNRDNAGLTAIIKLVPRGARVAMMPYSIYPDDNPLPIYLHVGGYVHAARGGYGSFSFGHVPYKGDLKRFALTPVIWSMSSSGWRLPPISTDFYDYVVVRKGPLYSGTPFDPLPASRKKRPIKIFADDNYELWETLR